MLSEDAPKARRFKICAICLLIFFIVSAFVVFVIRLARQPLEPFISVSLGRTNFFGGETNRQAVSIELTNTMSFNVNYLIETKGLHSGLITQIRDSPLTVGASRRYSCSLSAHSHRLDYIFNPSDGLKVHVSYQREFKPIELSIVNKLPWLQYYPFYHRYSTPIYEWKEKSE
jgi:hypothetical protein